MGVLRKAIRVAPDLRCRYWVENESRFGLKPTFRRRITARGMSPVALHHWQSEWVWLYNWVEPLVGSSFSD